MENYFFNVKHHLGSVYKNCFHFIVTYSIQTIRDFFHIHIYLVLNEWLIWGFIYCILPKTILVLMLNPIFHRLRTYIYSLVFFKVVFYIKRDMILTNLLTIINWKIKMKDVHYEIVKYLLHGLIIRISDLTLSKKQTWILYEFSFFFLSLTSTTLDQ